MRIAGASVDVLDPAGRAFVLALHSAKDGGRDEKPRRDLERALEILPPDLWRAAAEIAAAVGSGEAFAAGLRRCSAGRELSVELDLTPQVSREIALRQHRPCRSVGGHGLALAIEGHSKEGRPGREEGRAATRLPS